MQDDWRPLLRCIRAPSHLSAFHAALPEQAWRSHNNVSRSLCCFIVARPSLPSTAAHERSARPKSLDMRPCSRLAQAWRSVAAR